MKPIELACKGQCHGCALKPGAAANEETNNRLGATFAALGGIPFYCHEALGWTPDQEDYPGGESRIQRAVKNLMTAPKLIHDLPEAAQMLSDATGTGIPASAFAADRIVLGSAPVCAGWKAAIQKLKADGWFKNPAHRKVVRIMANTAIKQVQQFKNTKRAKQRKKVFGQLRESAAWFAKEHSMATGKPIDLEGISDGR